MKRGISIFLRAYRLTLHILRLDAVEGRGIPPWLDLDKANFRATVRGLPTKDDIALPVNEQLVVDLYSR